MKFMRCLPVLLLVLFAVEVAQFPGPLRLMPVSEVYAQPGPLKDLVDRVSQGALRVETEGGMILECPLKHTDVKVEISGMIARVRLVQVFHNPFENRIEAVYVFPLPHKGAVNEMTMVIGDRRIFGMIKKREEAKKIYEEAVKDGKTASLLEQERPNIFTQTVGNIPPGKEVRIEIGYVDVLRYDQGRYEFHFPLVVGPRYIPGQPTSETPKRAPDLAGKVGELPPQNVGEGAPKGDGWSPDTDRVPDASRITPPVLKPAVRTGHDIRLSVALDAGVPIRDLEIVAHRVDIRRSGVSKAEIALHPADSIPNKDFVLRYRVAGEKPEMALIAHGPEKGDGSFLLMIQPKLDESLKEAPPRDICFLVDVSGSMSGAPIAKVKEAMELLLQQTRPIDRIQVVTFAAGGRCLFADFVPATDGNVERALGFFEGVRAGGGTEMLFGVKMALERPDPSRLRIVLMLTDGYIGNEGQIIAEVGNRSGESVRFWVVGIGSSPNRYLVDGVADVTGGMGETLNINEDPAPLVAKISSRVRTAQLSRIELDWGGLPVHEIFPTRIPALWADCPVLLHGRFKSSASGILTVRAVAEGKPVAFEVPVRLPKSEPRHASVETVWAQTKIRALNLELQKSMYLRFSRRGKHEDPSAELKEKITRLGLEHKLVTAYTSFVAVEHKEILDAEGGPPERKVVPVPLPAGTKFGGFFKNRRNVQGGIFNMPFMGKYWNTSIGIGGRARGSFVGRFGGRRNLRACGGGSHTESTVLMGLIWLKNHQDPDGSWSTAGFPSLCKKGTCTGAGTGGSDLETTGLAVLAFLGAGHTPNRGKFKATVKRTAKFLKGAQNPDGSFGGEEGAREDIRDHAICAAALAEMYGLSNKSPLLQGPAQKAVDHLVDLQTPYSGWGAKKGAPCDSITTGWATLALKSAKISGLHVPKEGFDGASSWFNKVTEESDYRIGFMKPEDRGAIEGKPGSNSLTSSATGTIGRIFILGRKAKTRPEVLGAAKLLMGALPKWDVKSGSVDMEYWFFGTLSMFQLGGSRWKAWNPALKNALVPTQKRQGCENGSWDPVGSRGKEMGRVWSTAISCLSLEIYYRYRRVLQVK